MFAVAEDLLECAQGVAPEALVVIEASPEFPGELVFQPLLNEQEFYRAYKDWMSCYLVLNQLSNLVAFVAKITADGYAPVFGPSAAPILENVVRWSAPLDIEGYTFYPFQSFGLNRALERAALPEASDRLHFFNWSAGAGKSYCSAAGAKELFTRGMIDVVLAFTLSKAKDGYREFFEYAGLDVVINDGAKDKRRRVWKEGHQVYVNNYEKSWHDIQEITPLVEGQSVLFLYDECHKLITDGKQNKSRRALDGLQKLCFRPIVWPMSATVVGGSPLRYRDVYSLNGYPRRNPLGSKDSFEKRYARSVRTVSLVNRNGGQYETTFYDWDLGALQDIRHRVADRTQAIRKTDPGVIENFKGFQTIEVPIEMGERERALTEIITEYASDARDRGENLMPYYRMLRYTANTPRALAASTDEIAKEICAQVPELVTGQGISTKSELLNEYLESMREAGDKAVVFTQWTNLTLYLVMYDVSVPYVAHYGVDQQNWESTAAIKRFMTEPDITCFFSSDAGSHALNLQAARYVIQFEPTYSYDDTMQRASRIDRADSHLDGLTNYVFLTENSVEERVWRINNERRELAAAVQGTAEELSYDGRAFRSEEANLSYLIFGE